MVGVQRVILIIQNLKKGWCIPMCLKNVTKVHSVEAYKVFKREPSGRLLSPFKISCNDGYVLDDEYSANPSQRISSEDNKNSYFPGFHAILSLEDAKKYFEFYKKSYPSEDARLYRVLLTGIMYEGQDFTGPIWPQGNCVVGAIMKIVEEVEEEQKFIKLSDINEGQSFNLYKGGSKYTKHRIGNGESSLRALGLVACTYDDTFSGDIQIELLEGSMSVILVDKESK
jgi:hypothetical protein